MAETIMNGQTENEMVPTEVDFQPIAEIAQNLGMQESMAAPLAVSYIRHLDEQRTLKPLPAVDQLAAEPYHARAFVQKKVTAMDPAIRRGYHRIFSSLDANWRYIDIDAQIEGITRQYGTYGQKQERLLPEGFTDREWYLDQYIKYAVQPAHYHRYPEILAAYRLAEQLRILRLEGMADGVDILVAAQGRELHLLPDKDKSLPRGVLSLVMSRQNQLVPHPRILTNK